MLLFKVELLFKIPIHIQEYYSSFLEIKVYIFKSQNSLQQIQVEMEISDP